MAREVAAIIGSGTIKHTYGILDPAARGIESGAEGVRTGTQVMVANFEDNLATDAFAASGVTVGTSSVEVLGPHINPLPRMREVILENTGTNPILISHQASFTDLEAYRLAAGGGVSDVGNAASLVTLSVLHNVSVYARATGGSSTLRMLIL